MRRFVPIALVAVLLLTGAAAWGGSKTAVLGKASEIVVLQSVGSANVCGGVGGFLNSGLQRFLDDGTATPFVSPPEKSVLVVTEIDWTTSGGTANSLNTFWPHVSDVANPSGNNYRAAISTAISDASGSSGGNLTMTTGFVVGPDATICMRVTSPGGGTLGLAIFRGYLVKDK